MPRIMTRDFTNSLSLSGTGSRVRATVIPNLNLGTTFALWFKARSLAGNGVIVENSIGTSARLVVFHLGNILTAGFFNGTAYTSKASTTLEAGRWYCSVFTWDGTNTQLYIDGVQQVATTPTPQSSGTPNFTIGARGDNTVPFGGNVGQCAIWNRALSSDEASAFFISGTIPMSGLVGRYELNEGSGTMANDTSGSANNGTISNGTWSTDVPLKLRPASTGRVAASGRVSA